MTIISSHKLERLQKGYLEVTLENGKKIALGNKYRKPYANITIKNEKAIKMAMQNADIGIGQAYIDGLFNTTNLEDLLEFLILNEKEIKNLIPTSNFTTFLKNFSIKNLRTNKKDKKDIDLFYNLNSNFFQTFLDESMSYSSGIFEKNCDLKQAQDTKYQHIINQLNPKKKEILEIGCGWGGFIKLASQKGFHTTGLTLFKDQLSSAQKIIRENKLNSLAIHKDYRHEEKVFGNIVTIETFESVGKKNWNKFFKKVKSCLKKTGRCIIQTTVIDDELYEEYSKNSNYVKKFIYPSKHIPSQEVFEKYAYKNQLGILNKFEFGDSYIKTLRFWIENFNKNQKKVKEIGFDEELIKKWQFYLAYQIASFRAKRMDVVQYTLCHL